MVGIVVGMSAQTVHPTAVVGFSYLQSASQRFENSVDLACSPADLFAIFGDENSWPIWAPGFKRIEWTSPRPFGAGTTRTATLAGGVKIHEVFLAWDVGERMAFYFTGSNWNLPALGLEGLIEDYRVTDLSDGRSRLVWTLAFGGVGVARFFQPLARPLINFFLRRILQGLVRYVAKGDHARAA